MLCLMNHRRYLTLIAGGIFLAYSVLIIRYYKIQICEGERWEAEALNQHEFRVKDPCRRGTFFSQMHIRKGVDTQPQPLAVDITKFHLCLDSMAIPQEHRDAIAKELFILVGKGQYEQMRKEFDKKSRHRKLVLWLDHAERDRVFLWWKKYAAKHKLPSNSLFFISDYQRSYPFGKLLGQVLHTLREIKDEKTGKAFPTGGLEAYFNHVLEGEMGERKLRRSPLHRFDLDKIITLPKDGSDVYLTVNPCIQTIAEEELEKGVKEARAKSGRLVLMNAHSGEILALAQYPFFDPSEYKEYFNDREKIEHTKVMAVSDVFEPGSIMKPITMAIALLANEEMQRRTQKALFDPREPIDVTRTVFPGRKHFPLRDIVKNKRLNMYMAIQKSSNVYVAQLADRIVQNLGSAWYEEKLHLFGFGLKTHIELPGEAVGLVPSPKRCHANGTPEWSLSTPYSLAMGYNLLATSMQMVRAYAVLANGGYDVHPTLVKKIVTTSGQETLSRAQHSRQRVLSQEIVDEVLRAMRLTTSPGGTGFRASPKKHSSAGKTGTTEKLIQGKYDKRRHISSFIGITPIYANSTSEPLVMLVSIDDPDHGLREDGTKNYMGGRCAAPVFARVADRVLLYLGVPSDKENYDCTQEVQAIKALYEEWNR